ELITVQRSPPPADRCRARRANSARNREDVAAMSSTFLSPTRPRASLLAIGVLFFVNGATAASWLPRLPDVRDRLGISDAALGLTMVGMGVGGLAVSLLSGVIVDRFGSRRVAV